MVRIAHISDSHLGSSMFQLVERREDARKCLEKALDMCLRHSPDVIVHTGDLFDSPFANVEDQTFVNDLFKRVGKKAAIILIKGNHDIPFGWRYSQSPIRLLESNDLVVSTGDSETRVVKMEFDGETVEFHLISWTHGRAMNSLLNRMTPETQTAVLLAHHLTVPKDRLPIHYNYTGIGHAHNFWLDEEYDIGRPGSTCVVDWRREMSGSSKLIVVDISKTGNEYTTETLNDVREFRYWPGFDITGMGPAEVNNKMKQWIGRLSPKKKSKPIVIINVNGVVDSETERGIDRNKIIKYGESQIDPLFLHIEPNWKVIGTPSVELSEPLNVEKSVEEYMEQMQTEYKDEILTTLQEIAGA